MGHDMKLFLQVFFWIYLVDCFLRMVVIAVKSYPYEPIKRTLGMDLVCFFEMAFFVVWAGVLLWGGK